MSTYAIGDIQGCFKELMLLLEKINFNPSIDNLIFTGDLVNRGPDSLEVLKYLYSINDSVINVLGNHDLHLIAQSLKDGSIKTKDETLKPILESKKKINLIEWLRHSPILHFEKDLDILLVHAGIHPYWNINQAQKYAHEIETIIRADQPKRFFSKMYTNESWKKGLEDTKRYNAIVNTFTRMRYLTNSGICDFKQKNSPDKITDQLIPWFSYPDRKIQDYLILFGHWSNLNYHNNFGVICLDGGCVWGGQLIAINIKNPDLPIKIDSLKLK
jgi:bis(5'-nucleosyl)-tetraphosphatase (symmetrical)